MTRYAIHPFYFPTTVAFVDDNADFLATLCLQLDPRLAFRLFQDPFAGLVALNASTAPPSVKDFFSPYREREDDDQSRHVINISLKAIHREIHDEQRFEHISVVVVDYDMPEMNGLEFCRNLKNPFIKKILLTGEADERVAVKAFNERVIDRFVRKQDSEAMATLGAAILEMQCQYFVELERMISDALSVGSPRFLEDEKFGQHFRQICCDLDIVEYYLTCLPDGMLMRDASGASYLLMVLNDEHLRDAHDVALDQAAPEELLQLLRSGNVLPYFWKTEGFYSPIYSRVWRSFLHPAKQFEGRDWYFYALIKNPTAFNLKYALCYSDFLDQLDDRGERAVHASPRSPLPLT